MLVHAVGLSGLDTLPKHSELAQSYPESTD